ncbi:TerC family protein [Desulfitobacterium sp.]|uniref:TerC family protein n=1 Tax=Desulfitobacterium sp. TaxID=49981 RepID=UPI002C707D45|nr:TerC family protein [Desulfitobacterium sp.]HVJ50514.1 TerC family protein [Desulfitobacterium sp.]
MVVGFWATLLSIVIINLVLSGDNAVVIALATLRLGKEDRKKGIFWGTLGAVVLRIGLTTVAAMLLKIPFVQATGGMLLIWIAIRLLKEDKNEEEIKAASSLREAIQTIIFADLLMSLDNILAVAGASNGNPILLILGLAISIPIVIFGSTILSNLMKKWPWIVSIGAGLLGYTAGEMLLNDSFFHFLSEIEILNYLIPGLLAVGVIMIGNFSKTKKVKRTVREREEEDDEKSAI